MKALALLIGNGSYPKAKLKNPKNDANDLGDVLAKLGFTVMQFADLTVKQMDEQLDEFGEQLKAFDVGLFFFAGHGIQIKGENYLTAVNTEFAKELDVKHSSLSLNKVIDTMEAASVRTTILILDACRNNPYERAWDRSASQRGLASVYAPKGTIIAFATSPGETASDGKGRNGAYTGGLLKHIADHDIPIEEMFKRVRNTVSTITEGDQTSWEHTSLMGTFYFNSSFPDERRVAVYSKSAIKDGTFALESNNACHKTIKKLKSHDWYSQNPALVKFWNSDLSIYDKNSLFVLGRNIYQAACGNANQAVIFINNIHSRLPDHSDDISFHVLNGMLCEVYFDNEGKYRRRAKYDMYNELMMIEDIEEVSSSFAFIQTMLQPHEDFLFYSPGSKREIVIDIATDEDEEQNIIVKAVMLGGDNILLNNADGANTTFAKRHHNYGSYTFEKVVYEIAEGMVVPTRRLNVKVDRELDEDADILFPYSSQFSRRRAT